MSKDFRGAVTIGLKQVLADVFALKKVNYNARIFADGMPVTLCLADNICTLLIVVPGAKEVPLPFSYFI